MLNTLENNFQTDTFCFGEYKRSICCQKYLYASDILDDPATTTTQQPKRGFQSISMSMRQPLPGKIHDGQYLKPTTTSSSTTTTTTTTAPPPIVDQEFPQIAINSVGVRRFLFKVSAITDVSFFMFQERSD